MDRPEQITGPDRLVDTAGERWRLSYDTAGRLIAASPGGMFTTSDDKDGITQWR